MCYFIQQQLMITLFSVMKLLIAALYFHDTLKHIDTRESQSDFSINYSRNSEKPSYSHTKLTS